MGAHELLRRRLHPCLVQMFRHTGIIRRIEWRINGVIVDAVKIGLGVGGIPGVEVLRHHPRRQHPDVRGQVLVQRQRQLFRWDAGVGVEIEHKAQRVHARVGAAAALDVGPSTKHRFQGILKRRGDTAPVGLHLESAVIRAVVG